MGSKQKFPLKATPILVKVYAVQLYYPTKSKSKSDNTNCNF